MKIGLYPIDSKMVNIALMKISMWHKAHGHETELYLPILGNTYNKVYVSVLFNYTPKPQDIYIDNWEIGGSGFNIHKSLPREVESMKLDYSLYPDCDYTIQRFSLGCIRSCPFCIVSQKEGKIRPANVLNQNPKGKRIEIIDNNFFANPMWREAIETLQGYNQPVNFHGIDARTLTKEHAKALMSLKHHKQIHMAWDNPRERIDWKKIIKWIPAYKLMVYVLIGYWSTEKDDIMRVEKLRELKISPFVMPYDTSDRYQRDFARWVNMKAVFKSVKWKDYKKG